MSRSTRMASQDRAACRGGTPYQPPTVEGDDPAQRAKNNAFHHRGDEVKKMAPKDRADFTEVEWRMLCTSKREQLRERLAEQKAMPPGGPSPWQPSEGTGQHRRRQREENHEGAPPIVKGKILGGKEGKGETQRSPASRAAAFFSKAVQRCTGARPLKPSSPSSPPSSQDEKAKVKTYEVVRIGRALHRIPIRPPVAARKAGTVNGVESASSVPPPPAPCPAEDRQSPPCQHRQAVESTHTVLCSATISFPATPSQPIKQHRRKRSIIKSVFLPSARDKAAASSRQSGKRITTDMIQVVGGERIGASQGRVPTGSQGAAGGAHQAGGSIPRMDRRVTALKRLSDEDLAPKKGGPYKPRLLYPLLVVMKSYIHGNTVLHNFFVTNSLYLLPMPRPSAFRRETPTKRASISNPPKSLSNLLVWYPESSRTMLPGGAPRSRMEDFGASSFTRRSKPKDRTDNSTIRVSKRKRWFSLKAPHAVKTILDKARRKPNQAIRAAEDAELHKQYLEDTADISPAVSFDEWKRLRAAMADATRKRQVAKDAEQKRSAGSHGRIEASHGSLVRFGRKYRSPIPAYGGSTERVGKFHRAVARVFSGKPTAKQTSRQESRGETKLEIREAGVEQPRETEQTAQEIEALEATDAEEWEDVDPIHDSIRGPERMFPDTEMQADTDDSHAHDAADCPGLENFPRLYQTLYIKLDEAGKEIKTIANHTYGSCQVRRETSSTVIQEWFCPTVEEVKYAIKNTRSHNPTSAGQHTKYNTCVSNAVLLLSRIPTQLCRVEDSRPSTEYIHQGSPIQQDTRNSQFEPSCKSLPVDAKLDNGVHAKAFNGKEQHRKQQDPGFDDRKFEELYRKEGQGMTREYFKEFLEEKKNSREVQVLTRLYTASTTDKTVQPVASPGKKVVLRKWGDLGTDIPESTPASVRNAMMDLAKELQEGNPSPDTDQHLPVRSRSVDQGLLATKGSQQPKSSAAPTAPRAPITSGYQPTSHKRIITATQSIMETKPNRKETPPKHASYEPPRRPYLRPFGTMPEGIPTVNALQAKKNSMESASFRKDAHEPPLSTQPFRQQQTSEHPAEQGMSSNDTIERGSTGPFNVDVTKAPIGIAVGGIDSIQSVHIRPGAQPTAIPASIRSIPRDPPSKTVKQTHGTSPVKSASKLKSPTAASSGGYSTNFTQSTTTVASNPQRSISPVRRGNARLRPFGAPGLAPNEQMSFAKPRSHRDGPTTSSRQEGSGSSSNEQVDLQDPRYAVKGKQVEGKPPFRGGWI
ncbi:hypothetical protein Dda_4274 [Drechslerella dactyloides]|uniref:Uncharacterized protein n=1 Tax=Drechslerella dactyloides TaxID=74499 RepID=A0AAD6J0Y8_DREDA|nr:hypothetical protein Dda_4274 [Drechslerella dactyloides]